MVWGCMAANGVGNLIFIDGILDKVRYLKILGENLKGSVDKLNLPENYYSLDKTTIRNIRLKLSKNDYYTTHSTIRYRIHHKNPDLNPIERLRR